MTRSVIHPIDNVSIDIDSGHKYARCEIAQGSKIIKYGYPIGHATCDIASGEHVHTHNMTTDLDESSDYVYTPEQISQTRIDAPEILAYDRGDDIGIRNEIWIIPTVGCVNKIAEAIAAKSDAYAFTHPYGCSQLGGDHETTRRILRGLIRHPNAGGVLVLGLGCENNQLDSMREFLGEYNPERVKFLNCQDSDDEIADGLALVAQLRRYADTFKRTKVSVSRLKIGLKCGGSDGFSGITANPLVGRVCDRFTSMGASCALTEVPEMFGAESALFGRCVNREIFDRAVGLVSDYKRYFTQHGQTVYENPSPGNKAGGITTLEEKSLGCVQKGGKSPITDVIGYGEYITKSGLTLVDGPGNDICAVTNLTAVGCHLILFTTGRGTPLGAPVPTLKLASNSALAEKKSAWIDINAGRMLGGADLTDELVSLILSVAEGKEAKNELNACREIAIFKDGVTL